MATRAQMTSKTVEEKTEEDWGPRIAEIVDGAWYDATESWDITTINTQHINQMLAPYNLRIIAHREKLTNKTRDPKSGAVTQAAYRLLVRLVPRSEMLELENDARAAEERRRADLRDMPRPDFAGLAEALGVPAIADAAQG